LKSTDGPTFHRPDWFSWNIPTWQTLLADFANKPGLQFLEIGVFEGRATVWLLENILTNSSSKTVCVDRFIADPETQITQAHAVSAKETFSDNVRKYGGKVEIHVGASQEVLRKLPLNAFDFVYVDGSHRASNVLEDAVLSFRLMRVGGIMIFDDYGWGNHKGTLLHPKAGIDAFLDVFADQLVILRKEYQVAIRKIESPEG
jgi:predicted O-methyltransferase YrrM